MSARPLPGPTWAWATGVGIVGAALVALMAWAIANNQTDGEPVGRIDLVARTGSMSLDLAPGDVLHFRLDGVFVTPPGGAKERRSDLGMALRASTLKVHLAEASGAIRETTCAAYVGGGRLGPIRETTIEQSMVTECELRVATAGRHTVSATVAWANGVVTHASSVQVNVARAGGR